MPISTKETNRGNTEWEPGAEWQAFRYPCVCVIGLNSNPPLLSACMLRLLNCPWFPAVFSSSQRQTVLLCYCQIHFTVSRPLNHLHPEITASGRDIFSFGQKTEKRTQSHHKLFCKYTIDKKKSHHRSEEIQSLKSLMHSGADCFRRGAELAEGGDSAVIQLKEPVINKDHTIYVHFLSMDLWKHITWRSNPLTLSCHSTLSMRQRSQIYRGGDAAPGWP